MSKHWSPRVVTGRPGPGRRSRPRKGRLRSLPGLAALRLALLGGLFLGLGYALVPSPDAVIIAGETTRVENPMAIRITDGDTFRYAGEKIRIADIDTPEIRGRCEEESALAARATDRMEVLLQQAPFEMHAVPGRDEDRYGRKLRIVVRNGHSIGDQLVAEGLARTWEGRRRPWCA